MREEKRREKVRKEMSRVVLSREGRRIEDDRDKERESKC